MSLDVDALRAKYREERTKRLRADGTAQYEAMTGAFAGYLTDPYVEDAPARAAVDEEVDVLVIGGGFGGLLVSAYLRKAGVDNIRILEKAGDFGGTWYWNRYPGVACDVESYCYMPLLEEIGGMPSEKYAQGREILEHSRAIGRKFDLYDAALFRTLVTELRWDEDAARWIARTDKGDVVRARFVSMSTGPYNAPKLPGVPGIEGFKGHSFHTSRWDYAYTGGDSTGGLTGLQDKRVGIIGTGATAVQAIPHLGRWAKHLYVFQRTPSSIDFRNNKPTDGDWAGTLQPGWQKSRMENFNALLLGHAVEDEVQDGWTDAFRNLRPEPGMTPEQMAEIRQLADYEKMETIRARVDAVVKDPATAEALKPWYNQMCKRPCFHDDYLDTFNRPNVTLVDTQGRGVDRVTEQAVVANGQEYEIDCLIYATGFEWLTDYASRAGFETYGRGGMSQTEAWKDGVSSLYGFHSHNFPNRFIVNNSQQAFTANFTHMIDDVAQHLAFLIRHCLDGGISTVEPTAEAERQWVDGIVSTASMRRAFHEECTPGYFNFEGKPSNVTLRASFYGASIDFVEMLRRQQAERNFEGLELR